LGASGVVRSARLGPRRRRKVHARSQPPRLALCPRRAVLLLGPLPPSETPRCCNCLYRLLKTGISTGIMGDLVTPEHISPLLQAGRKVGVSTLGLSSPTLRSTPLWGHRDVLATCCLFTHWIVPLTWRASANLQTRLCRGCLTISQIIQRDGPKQGLTSVSKKYPDFPTFPRVVAICPTT